MTKEEALQKIEELKKFVENMDNTTGFKDDPIFLLSVEEYEKYKDTIPVVNCWWWLRPSGSPSDEVAYVYIDGSVSNCGLYVNGSFNGVRPALKISNLLSTNLKVGNKFVSHGYTWIYLGDDIAISEMPLMFSRFDEESNDYETSEIRNNLLKWYEERK